MYLSNYIKKAKAFKKFKHNVAKNNLIKVQSDSATEPTTTLSTQCLMALSI